MFQNAHSRFQAQNTTTMCIRRYRPSPNDMRLRAHQAMQPMEQAFSPRRSKSVDNRPWFRYGLLYSQDFAYANLKINTLKQRAKWCGHPCTTQGVPPPFPTPARPLSDNLKTVLVPVARGKRLRKCESEVFSLDTWTPKRQSFWSDLGHKGNPCWLLGLPPRKFVSKRRNGVPVGS